MMKHNRVLAGLAACGMVLAPVLVLAQEVSITRSVLQDLPYTLIYPAVLQATGGGVDPVTLNHPQAPLQCDMHVVPVEDTSWTVDGALAELDDAEVASAWADTLPGFAVASKGTVQYQDAAALTYEGTSTDSAMGMPLTLVHTETVASGRGYVLDCLFAADQAEQARPLVDFIVTNFSTRADAECCIGVTVVEPEPPAAQ
ncbi:hypothetical protein [Devosia rhizoryzae]|uniref:Uncharacterized protein n=1 Tax=Devosia rhizoryzae TaxID=2774137 RepID=A0ABX7C7S9_9HYPH|nr:hypothetical protein [Devosia rhizoryzae]QQR40323.1 hypothetical protein JI748_04755 [Devosia rhizoryzae]